MKAKRLMGIFLGATMIMVLSGCSYYSIENKLKSEWKDDSGESGNELKLDDSVGETVASLNLDENNEVKKIYEMGETLDDHMGLKYTIQKAYTINNINQVGMTETDFAILDNPEVVLDGEGNIIGSENFAYYKSWDPGKDLENRSWHMFLLEVMVENYGYDGTLFDKGADFCCISNRLGIKRGIELAGIGCSTMEGEYLDVHSQGNSYWWITIPRGESKMITLGWIVPEDLLNSESEWYFSLDTGTGHQEDYIFGKVKVTN